MATSIFVNLAVKDLDASKEFYTALGYSINPQFTDDKAACVVISDTIYAMLLVHGFFAGFTAKQIADSSAVTEVILALSVDTREDVDALTERALANGGAVSNETNDLGFMYQRSFQDPDGHLWEVFWMDPVAAQNGPPSDGVPSP